MLFLWNRYRILKKIIFFGYRYGAVLSPTMRELSVFPLSKDGIIRHVMVLERQGFVSIAGFSKEDGTVIDGDSVVQVTPAGITHFFELKRSVVSGALTFAGTIATTLLGFYLGLKQGAGQQEAYQHAQHQQCSLNEMKACFNAILRNATVFANVPAPLYGDGLYHFLSFLLLLFVH